MSSLVFFSFFNSCPYRYYLIYSSICMYLTNPIYCNIQTKKQEYIEIYGHKCPIISPRSNIFYAQNRLQNSVLFIVLQHWFTDLCICNIHHCKCCRDLLVVLVLILLVLHWYQYLPQLLKSNLTSLFCQFNRSLRTVHLGSFIHDNHV